MLRGDGGGRGTWFRIAELLAFLASHLDGQFPFLNSGVAIMVKMTQLWRLKLS